HFRPITRRLSCTESGRRAKMFSAAKRQAMAPVKYRNRVLALLAALSVLTYLDRVCISVAAPRIQSELDLSPQDWGLVTGAFAIAYAMFEIPSGYLGDRFGARALLARFVLWWSA